ncbi:putative Zinc finger, DHHC-type, palmitoyltransferase protein [Trachipleistophora hominis]|uniref:Palmitoyltransferase n=1 Tax=Trachipleistophora hominis TaxID=72359 RepID=L7JS94_TRAHO|nr:putative Zinc finger, DHHC-type, palmitoyltransferase protein [Trachipleistophora hominis]
MLIESILKRTIKVLELFLITITALYYITNLYICMRTRSLPSMYLLAVSLYYYIKTMRVHDYVPPNKHVHGVCMRCHHLRYASTHHCMLCDRCYDDRSHHCAWISGCVYGGNKNEFVFFVLFAVLHGVCNLNVVTCFVVLMGCGFLVVYFLRGNRVAMDWRRAGYVLMPWLERRAKVVDEEC